MNVKYVFAFLTGLRKSDIEQGYRSKIHASVSEKPWRQAQIAMNEHSHHDDRVAAIVQTIQAVEQSSLSVNQYFKANKTPFGRVQYYL